MSCATKPFSVRLLLGLAFLAPAGYITYISAVAVHEVLGHGLSAKLLGGTFDGFALMPDGMGWASVDVPNHRNLVLAAGVVSGTLFAIGMVFLAYWAVHPLTRLLFLLFAVCSFQDALPYAFWNSVVPRPPGDFGRILLDVQSESLRWVCVLGFGWAYLTATVVCNIAIFRNLQSILGVTTNAHNAIVAYGLVGMGGAVAWFGFDWNQVIEDVGRVPQFVGAGLQLAMAPLVMTLRRGESATTEVSPRAWTIAIAAAWLAAAILLAVLLLWLQNGIYWDGP